MKFEKLILLHRYAIHMQDDREEGRDMFGELAGFGDYLLDQTEFQLKDLTYGTGTIMWEASGEELVGEVNAHIRLETQERIEL